MKTVRSIRTIMLDYYRMKHGLVLLLMVQTMMIGVTILVLPSQQVSVERCLRSIVEHCEVAGQMIQTG